MKDLSVGFDCSSLECKMFQDMRIAGAFAFNYSVEHILNM